MHIRSLLISILMLVVMAACRSTEVLNEQDLRVSDESASELVPNIPDYSENLQTLRGKGKAIVSEPNHSERATVYFSSNNQKSLVTIKNNLGIEGGQLLAANDSLLIYNKVDKIARKIAIREGNLSRLDHLASVNILDIVNYTFSAENVRKIYEDENHYLFLLTDGRKVYVDKEQFNVRQIDQPTGSNAPYSRIIYDAYAEINGFILPRRVTIFSIDKRSKIALLIQSIEINPDSLTLNVDIPENITVTKQ